MEKEVLLVESEGDSPNPDGIGEPDNEPQQMDDDKKAGLDSITHTQAFSKRLAEARAKDLQRISELERGMQQSQQSEEHFNRLQTVLRGLGYEGSIEEIADMLEAQSREISLEELRGEREAKEQAIQMAIENSPEIIEARSILALQQELANKAMFESQLAKITQLNPDIKTLQDLSNMPDYDVFDGLLSTGKYTIDTAYKRLMDLRGSYVKQDKEDTKGHLHTVGGASGSAYDDVPSDVMEQYKIFMPNATTKEIREHYKKSHGGK